MTGLRTGAARVMALVFYSAMILIASAVAAPPQSIFAAFGSEASASSLDREALEKYFPKPLMVGERDATLPVWPIFQQAWTNTELVAYAFELVDSSRFPVFPAHRSIC